MKLILVSQNRKRQIEYCGLEILNTTKLDTRVYANIHSCDIVCRDSNGKEMLILGSYATEERALEIMEDIIDLLKANIKQYVKFDIGNKNATLNFKNDNIVISYDDGEIIVPSYIVYEFPKE